MSSLAMTEDPLRNKECADRLDLAGARSSPGFSDIKKSSFRLPEEDDSASPLSCHSRSRIPLSRLPPCSGKQVGRTLRPFLMLVPHVLHRQEILTYVSAEFKGDHRN